ncbi:MAG: YlmH/Sll1252 family protein [Atopostipes sp.]|nr:YlmH/Sll1252 family protein [Atopostipes sp.]
MDIYQHFRKEEQLFIDQVLDWVSQVDVQYSPYLTNFLNPREIFIAESIIRQYSDIKFRKYGGLKDAERERILIYPPYFEPKKEDFEISLFEIDYPTKFAELSHGQVLGSIMATGLARANLGDIITDGIRWQFLIDKKMDQFIKLNLEMIGKNTIYLERKELFDTLNDLNHWKKEELIISSLRLDSVLAKALHLSRNQAKKLINKKKVKMNWSLVERPDVEVDEFDVISIRGFGRIKMYKPLRKTRKENLVVEVGIINRNS